MPLTKGSMTPGELKKFEFDLTKEFASRMEDTREDLRVRVNGVTTRAGGSGMQFAGYTTLERYYRGDQWEVNEPPGASQRTDNYCAVIVDNLSSLIFDGEPEVNCPTDDPSEEILEVKAEIKENLIKKVWDDNEAEVEFDELSKIGSLYGDSFILGPWAEKVDKNGDPMSPDAAGGTWKIRFSHVENPGSIRLIFADSNFKKLIGFIEEENLYLSRANDLHGEAAKRRNIKLQTEQIVSGETRLDGTTNQPMVKIYKYWTNKVQATFVNEKLLDFWFHNWGFLPIEYIKNSHSPNHPFGKSDIEDILDPQGMHNRTNNDLANLLRWLSTVNMWGKNLEGMQALVAGLSRIYSLPEEGELHTFEKPGDAYITNTFVQQRRSAILDVSGVSDAMMSSSQLSVASGRALAVAFQGTIRKLNPKLKRYARALQSLNEKILRLYEIYYPETKNIIGGDYRNKVFLPATILRNIVDTINKFQSGLISLDTAQREVGVNQPKLEQKLMKKALEDPILGPQVARQPALLPQLTEGENQPGEQPMPGPGQKFASPGGAVAANNQQASGAAPVPVQ